MPNIKRGEIYYASLEPVVGSEQGGNRPVLVVQNDVGNRFSPTTIVAAISFPGIRWCYSSKSAPSISNG